MGMTMLPFGMLTGLDVIILAAIVGGTLRARKRDRDAEHARTVLHGADAANSRQCQPNQSWVDCITSLSAACFILLRTTGG